ncbi:hypothetical protein U1Q18_021847 [Sarracenia purpurea var. burkii]
MAAADEKAVMALPTAIVGGDLEWDLNSRRVVAAMGNEAADQSHEGPTPLALIFKMGGRVCVGSEIFWHPRK